MVPAAYKQLSDCAKMVKKIPEEKLQAIEAVVSMCPDGISLRGGSAEIPEEIPSRDGQKVRI